MSCIAQINAALKKAGTHHVLQRDRSGYYYLRMADGHPPGTRWIECSIYVWRLEADDFNFAAEDINEAFVRAKLPAPLTLQVTA
jgi:hypothetical protein